MKAKSALDGLKVLDFSWAGAAPLATNYLGNFGAQVIKIESAKILDITRVSTPFKDNMPGANRSGCFAMFNQSKYSMGLDFNNPKGLDIAGRLVAWADMVVESFAPGVLKKWGLNYEELIKIKPDIIMLSSSNQGQVGPYGKHPAFGFHVAGLSGFTHLTGWPDKGGVGPAIAYSDFTSPWHAVIAILAALDYRRRTGKGQYIDLSQSESGVAFVRPVILDYILNGREQRCRGNRSSRAAPHGAYRCKGDDRWCTIAVYTDEEWNSFCGAVGNTEWTKDSRFITLLDRLENADELDKLVETWTAKLVAEEIIAVLQEAGVAAGIVQSCEDLMDKDPQLKHRRFYQELEHPELGRHKYHTPPLRLSKTPFKLDTPPPCLGEHTEYICREILGMNESEFIDLLNEGIFE